MKECEALRSSYGNKYTWEEQSEELVSRMIGVVEGKNFYTAASHHSRFARETSATKTKRTLVVYI